MGARVVRAAVAVSPIVVAAAILAPGCGTKPPENPAYLVVQLIAATKEVKFAAVRIASPVLDTPEEVCLGLSPATSTEPASFVLRRDYGRDPKTQVTITVTGYAALKAASGASAGAAVPCPSTRPDPVGPSQTLKLGFCADGAGSRAVQFIVGSECCVLPQDGGAGDAGMGDAGDAGDAGMGGAGTGGMGAGGAGTGGAGTGGSAGGATNCPPCGAGQVCGAGVDTDGFPCPPGACCSAAIAACTLPNP